MANEATIFDSFARYNDALLGIEEARIRREQAAVERGRMEILARGIRDEARADAKAAQLEERIGRENEIMMMGENAAKARAEAVKAQQDQLAERRANATKNAKVLQKAIADADGELAALVDIPLAVKNANARLVAETRTKDKAILDKFFNPKSVTDNSLNFARIPGAEQEALFLSQQLAQLNDAAIAHRRPQIQSVTAKRDINLRLLDEIIRDATLSDEDFASGSRAAVAPAVPVSDLAAAAAAFLPGGAETPPAAPTNPRVGVAPGIVRSIFGAGALPAPVPGAMLAAQAAVPVASPGAMQAAESASIWRSPVVAPTTPVSQVFNAPGAPSGAEMQPGSFNMDGIQKIQAMLEEAYGPDSFIPGAEIEPTLQKARQMGWTEQQVEAARAEILGSKNVFGGAYPALLGVWRQSKAMSQGIPAPIQPGQSPGMQFRSGW